MNVAGEGFIGLAEVIGQVRRELTQAWKDGEGESVRFAVDRVHLEFAVQVHRAADGRAGLRIGVLTADVGGGASRDTTHRIEVELTPETEEPGGMLRVGRRPAPGARPRTRPEHGRPEQGQGLGQQD
ncbi:trypco2 family protein [Streptomyces sp. DSM 44917]|uniref:Trypco2 family protein n=1 Tax=Streptomyces boetiae TaxID=3075541 RepID=A0ABU2LBU7_9ACTN|nr:trypco2 family protein [Streptomyces sp. DSM 44917]MDT0309029.1 trypco2 family protein [Streptomyces sp. DSM 44917]